MAIERSKSKATRDRIEAAARAIFSAHGYERSTIRTIAAAAHIHPSMVMRYFGSKEALFAKVVQFDLLLPDMTYVPPEERGDVLVRHFLQRWENGDGALPALLRASASNAEAKSRMNDIFETQLTAATAAMGDPATAGRRATLVASQMLGLALIRYVLAFKTARSISREEIVQSIGPTIQSYLEGR